jgi:hypothetical protein
LSQVFAQTKNRGDTMEKVVLGWVCPWCGKAVRQPARHHVICHSKMCECGAIGLGAAPWDTDEIIDDAINLFGIAEGYSSPLDADRLIGLKKIGVEMREGQTIPAGDESPVAIRILWFRRKIPGTTKGEQG